MSTDVKVWSEVLLSDPEVMKLIRGRAKLRWSLSALMSILFFGFLLSTIYARPYFSMQVGLGTMPFGFVLVLGMSLMILVSTGIYVYVSNVVFGPQTERILSRIRK